MKRMVVLFMVCVFLTFAIVKISTTVLANGPERSRDKVTFSKDVAPIFFANCVECHRPGEIAPMSLLTYRDARPWARSIKEKVLSGEMPPWSADPRYGHFANDCRLSPKDIDTIVAWVDQGAERGNDAELPPPPVSAQGWRAGTPDLVLSMPAEIAVPPNGPDQYIYVRIPTTFTDDRWIQTVEIHPANRRIVHHVNVYIETPRLMSAARFMAQQQSPVVGEAKKHQGEDPPSVFEADQPEYFEVDGSVKRVKMDWPAYDDTCGASVFNGGEGVLLGEYGPGKDTDTFPEGTAKEIPAGSNLILNLHYSNSSGQAQKDRTEIGLTFSKTAVRKVATTRDASNYFFKIMPGVENYEVKSCYTFDRDVELISYLPHMHLRGKDMKYEVLYPDGHRETLLLVRYNFNWQRVYKLKTPLRIPKGTTILITAHFDNSPKNKYNPDPTKTVRFGQTTSDEMMAGLFDYVVDNPRP